MGESIRSGALARPGKAIHPQSAARALQIALAAVGLRSSSRFRHGRALFGSSGRSYSMSQRSERLPRASGGKQMSMTRRQALASAGAAALAAGLSKPAIAAKPPILIGYLPALTGPSSSTGVGINRGTQLAVQEINAAGGIDGRQIELITRDTQSDPTKAVNAAAELTRGQKVSVVLGPVNSGESLAVVPLLARTNTPQIHPCWVDTLTGPKKYPMCFRNAPTNQQIGGAANHYVVDVLKRKKVAVISDTTGYGTASLDAYVPMLKSPGATMVYQSSVEAK